MQHVLDGRELMQEVATDRPGAFERLVATYEARVKAAVRRSVRDKGSVDDLAQEVFLRLYRARHRYQPSAKFETFLHRIVFNLCVNHTQFMNRRRTWSLDAAREPDDGPGYEPPDERAGMPHEDLELAERATILRAAVEELPDSQRRALMLSRFEALSHEEVGRVMDLSVQAVKSLLWRARENLRKTLRPILDEEDEP